MDQRRFQRIAEHCRRLEDKEAALRGRQLDKLYNPPANSHHPLAFARLEDALEHENLSASIEQLRMSRVTLANNARDEGFPTGRWIKIEGPEVCDNEATGIILREKHSGDHELQIWDWTLVLAEG